MMPAAGVIDLEVAREFVQAIHEKADAAELVAIGQDLTKKAELFRRSLGPEAIFGLETAAWRRILRTVFAGRQRCDNLLAAVGLEDLSRAVYRLLHSRAPLTERFETFCGELLSGPAATVMDRGRIVDLAGELLHFADPGQYWLWTRWLWNPETRSGALPLVMAEDFSLDAGSLGEIYTRVGLGTALLSANAQVIGFEGLAPAPFHVDMFLAGVYGVYFFATIRMRMSREFTQILPSFTGVVRRLLGCYQDELLADGGGTGAD